MSAREKKCAASAEEEDWKTVPSIRCKKSSYIKLRGRNSDYCASQMERAKLYASSLRGVDLENTDEQRRKVSAQIDECIVALWSFGRDSFLCDVVSTCCALHHFPKDTEFPIEVQEIICYGIGNFSEKYSPSMLQMACALLLRYLIDAVQSQACCNVDDKGVNGHAECNFEECLHREKMLLFFNSLELIDFLQQLQQENYGKFSRIDMKFYDPCTSALEKRMLEENYNVMPLETNEQGKRQVNHSQNKTIFYMPHCPMRLYSNVLWANWEKSILTNIIILGNSLLAYNDRIIDSTERNDPTNAILQIAPFVFDKSLYWRHKQKHRLETTNGGSPLANVFLAFNDFSISRFSSSGVSDDLHQNLYWPPRPEEFFSNK